MSAFSPEVAEAAREVERLRGLLAKVKAVKAKRRFLRLLRDAQQDLRDAEQGEKVRASIRKCRECPLGRKRTNAVPYVGPTHGRAELVIVGEAPGENEDHRGEPFVGRSGRKLDQMLEQAGTHRSRVFICNTLCCRPPENRDPKAEELEACLPNFQAQLDLADVPVGVTLGGYAYANVMGEARSSIKVGEVAGIPTWRNGMIWIPTYHPAYALRAVWAGSEIKSAITTALALRKGTMKPPIPPWQQVEVDGKKIQGLDDAIKKKGWALVHSKTLGQQILVVDEQFKDRGPGRLPEKIEHLPRYEMQELIAMGMLGKGMGGWKPEQLQAVHMVKHEFGGKVMLT